MAFADVRGARLAWQQMGEGEDVVLVHGLGTHRGFWLRHALALSREYRVTLFDLRGHGYSDRTPSGYSPEALGHDLLGLMDALDIPEAALIGHSYGGAAVLEAAVTQPQRVRALGVLDARNLHVQPQMWLHDCERLTAFEAALVADADLDWSREPQIGLRFLEVSARRQLNGTLPATRDPVTPFGEGRGASRTARRWLDLLEQTDAWEELNRPGASLEQLAALRMPVALVYGRLSRCLPSGQALRRLLPRADYLEIADGGHFFPLSHEGTVMQALRGLLAPAVRVAA